MSIEDCIGTSDMPYWLRVARLVLQLAELGHRGRSSLLKMDGLRQRGRIYTVLIDGDPDSAPAFREDSAQLCETLERALNAVPLPVGLYSANTPDPGAIAGPLARLDAFARTGAVVSVRVDHARAPKLLQVHVGFGEAYFHVEGSELRPLLKRAITFAEALRTSP
ncbi:hypothetical protein [Luteibacter sp. SG786]|uniref:hypothetical protein n=1 Tax=Luteibacter sp. SG786 TaxID=2587130 RepID=UPI001422E7D0|nr:hypothetical protein [Luteibacter sp. SG786]NII52786.1 hypothetical protein [Luteibacter sp. SG786]